MLLQLTHLSLNHTLTLTPCRSGRRKKRTRDKASAVVVPSLDTEDAAGEPMDIGDAFEGQGDAAGSDLDSMATSATETTDPSV